jgi:hypothetical protein
MLLIESTHAAEMQRGLVKNIFATFCTQDRTWMCSAPCAGLRTVRLYCIIRQVKILILI